MAHLHAQAAQRSIARLSAHVSLVAEPCFAVQGFAVEARWEVGRTGAHVYIGFAIKYVATCACCIRPKPENISSIESTDAATAMRTACAKALQECANRGSQQKLNSLHA